MLVRILCVASLLASTKALPFVITTWPYPEATDTAFETIVQTGDHVEAVVAGCDFCDMNPDLCRNSVGPGKPNEEGETTLDALIMDGTGFAAGAVGCLKRVQKASEVAHAVMKYTHHTLLVGEDATNFALSMGFSESTLETNDSRDAHEEWIANNCQPNFWKNVNPDPTENCGPYSPIPPSISHDRHCAGSVNTNELDINNHDTIGMVVVSNTSQVAAGCSTNGLRYKISGRVGDSPIPGAGAYADSSIGGAAATGNGDLIMRFLPTFVAVYQMGQGMTPAEAAETALRPIANNYPDFFGALIAVNNDGNYGAACFNYGTWNFTIRETDDQMSRIESVSCFET